MESQEELIVSIAPTVINAKPKNDDQRFSCHSCDYVAFTAKLLTTHVQTKHPGQLPYSSCSNSKTYVDFEDTSSNAKVELDPLQCCGDNRFDLASMSEQVTDCAFKNTDVKQEILENSEVPSNFREAVMVGNEGVCYGSEKTDIFIKKEIFDYMEETVCEKTSVGCIVEETEFGDNKPILKAERCAENKNVTTSNNKNNNSNEICFGHILKSEEIDLGVDIRLEEPRYGFQCRKCDFQSGHGNDFRNHFKLHLVPENNGHQEVTKLLENCHVLFRKDLWADPTKLKCEYCPYESMNQGDWKIHMITNHLSLKNPDTINLCTFNCDMCLFTTNLVERLTNHEFLAHAPFIDRYGVTTSPIDIKQLPTKNECKQKVAKLFKCESCKYKSKHEFRLRKHNLKHKPQEELKWFECEHCSYKTKLNVRLQQHMRKHKEAKCNQCSYKSFGTACLQRHVAKYHKITDKKVGEQK